MTQPERVVWDTGDKKKHGLKIINPSQLEVVSKENNKNSNWGNENAS